MAYLGTKPANQVIDSTLIADGTITPSDLSTGKPVWDTSGNLGIGTSSPTTWNSAGFAVRKNSSAFVGDSGSSVKLELYNNGNTTSQVTFGQGFDSGSDSVGFIYNRANAAFVFGTNNTERMRIDASGNLLIGTTTNFGVLTSSTSAGGGWAMSARTTGAGAGLIRGLENSTERFVMYGNGDAYNRAGVWGSLSDVKLKENIEDATPKLEKLNQVRVVNYNLKTDPEQKLLGVIAQELEQIFPGMVHESPDRDAEGNDLGTTTKQVKYSVFVPMLIQAIQELKAELDTVKSELQALKG